MRKPDFIAARMSVRRLPVLVWIGIFCVACVGIPASPAPPETALPISTSAPLAQPTLPSATPVATAAPVATPTVIPTSAPWICSPFPGYTAADLLAAISNPFNPPPLGSDDPHQAVDLAVMQPGTGIGLTGDPVQAVLAGTVAMVVRDRFPYGNALLIETELTRLPETLFESWPVPTPAPTLPPHPALTCPGVTPPAAAEDAGGRSLYLLYAHFEGLNAFQPGDRVSCGALIGRVGQSGNALHPHLHIEARIGPPGARFSGMAHYETRAVPEEMGNYCLWRVSNLFQLVDPTQLINFLP